LARYGRRTRSQRAADGLSEPAGVNAEPLYAARTRREIKELDAITGVFHAYLEERIREHDAWVARQKAKTTKLQLDLVNKIINERTQNHQIIEPAFWFYRDELLAGRYAPTIATTAPTRHYNLRRRN
jgi:hypothetical protein